MRERWIVARGAAWRTARWLGRMLRQALGWFCIALGLIGLALPVLQGMPFLVIGVLLVGRRHRLIRLGGVIGRRILRRWAALPTPLIGPLGRMALRLQRQLARQLRHLLWAVHERRGRAAQAHPSLEEQP